MSDPQVVAQQIAAIIGRLLSDKGGDSGHIPLDAPLFAGGLGLDSADSLHLVVALEDEFNIEFDDADLTVEVFESINSLADVVVSKLAGQE